MNENNTENTLTDAYEAHKKDLSALPKPICASIHPMANTGSIKKDGFYTNSAFNIRVKCEWVDKNGVKRSEWKGESEWLIMFGMKTTRRVYNSIEKARAAKAEILEKWGVAKVKKVRKSKKDEEIAALTEMVLALRAELAKKAA